MSHSRTGVQAPSTSSPIDLSLRERIRLRNGRTYTALEIQLVYLEACEAHARQVGM